MIRCQLLRPSNSLQGGTHDFLLIFLPNRLLTVMLFPLLPDKGKVKAIGAQTKKRRAEEVSWSRRFVLRVLQYGTVRKDAVRTYIPSAIRTVLL